MPRLKDLLSSEPLPCYSGVSSFHYAFTFLLLTPGCAGRSQVTGPSQPIVATVGDDIILPCYLEPAADASGMTVEWSRPDLDPRFVHVWRDGVELESQKNPSYKGRTSVSVSKLKRGDVSLTLSSVRISDEGKYRCFVPGLEGESTAELVVGVASFIVISLVRTDEDKTSGAVLQCESRGWYPEPLLLWLDAEGNLLPAGPTETVPGPDGLYTVSGRATVEQRHGSSFTCRVQQSNTNQSRETHIQVADDFFMAPPSSVVRVTITLCACFLCVLIVVVVIWQTNKNRMHQELKSERELKRVQQVITALIQHKKDLKTQKDKHYFLWHEVNTQIQEVQTQLDSIWPSKIEDKYKIQQHLKKTKTKTELENLLQTTGKLLDTTEEMIITIRERKGELMNKEQINEHQKTDTE